MDLGKLRDVVPNIYRKPRGSLLPRDCTIGCRFNEGLILRILWVKTELLHPVDKGGKIRTYHMLKHLMRDHHVTYLSLDDGPADQEQRRLSREYCHELVTIHHRTQEKFTLRFYGELAINLLSGIPYAVRKYQSPQMEIEIRRRIADGKHDIVVCDFLAPSINLPDFLGCPSVLFQHNVEAMIWKRHYEVSRNLLSKAYLYLQWQKMKRLERRECQKYDRVVAVSSNDRLIFETEYGVSALSDVPTGVDFEFFTRGDVERVLPNSLVFTGSMDWLPNEDAICYFSEAILPRVQRQIADVSLTIVGRNPSPRVLDLSRTHKSIQVAGRVEDVRPYMERAAVYIVPIRIGGGTRLKIYEAMSLKMPIVSTTVGAEGLPLESGRELLIADTADEFAGAIIRVLRDHELAKRLGHDAALAVRERFGWKNAAEAFAEACSAAIAAYHARRSVDMPIRN